MRRWQPVLIALTWSVAAHLLLLTWMVAVEKPERVGRPGSGRPTVVFDVRASTPVAGQPARSEGPRAPALELGRPVDTVPGPADVYSRDPASPWPGADVNTPDPRAATRGGGDTGAPERWTGRSDPYDLRTQPWNSPDQYRLPRRDDGDDRTSPEALPRLPDPDIDDAERERGRLARVDQPAPAPRAEPGAPADDPARDADGARSPAGAPGDGAVQPERRSQLGEDGEIVTRTGRPVVKEGAEATEAPRRGPRADDADSSQASNETDPGRIEYQKPSSGGVGGKGVAGAGEGRGNSARSPRQDGGQGGTPEDVARRPGGTPTTEARAQDAWFRRMRKKIADGIVYPPELAVGLEQGEVLVTFTLFKDGTVSDIKVTRSSGFEEFDSAVVLAIKRAAPFGPVPRAIVGGGNKIQVNTPIVFDNPIIR